MAIASLERPDVALPEPQRSAEIGTSSPLPALALSSVGLVDIVIGYLLGWHNKPDALALFYIGFVGMCAPAAWVLVSTGYSRAARLVTGIGLAVLLYLAYFLSSPLLPSRFDETLHTGTLTNLLRTGELFGSNPMLPVSPYYPGLELVAAGIHWLTGLPIVACQFLVVLISRVVLILVLFLLVERFTGSARAAGVGVLLYCGSTQFFFFNAQFSYQTIALTFALGLVFLVQRALDRPGDLFAQLAMAGGPIIALALSHHLTSWAAVATIWAWALAHRFNGNHAAARVVGAHALLATVIIGGWTALLASKLSAYLGPLFRAGLDQFTSIVAGHSKSKALFADASGYTTPTWERLVTAGSVAVWLALVSVTLWGAWRGRSLGQSRVRWLPMAIAASYPLLIAARISPVASDIADRASTFIYFAMALLIAAWLAPRFGRRPAEIAVAAIIVLLLGGTIIGSGPDWSRVPGPYLVSAEQRSIDATDLHAVSWAADHLPAGSRVASDSTINRLLVAKSDLDPLTGLSNQVNVAPLFYADTISDFVVNFIRTNRIDFVIVDTRVADSAPHTSSIYEPEGDATAKRLTKAQLGKFVGVPGFVPVFTGPVIVYDVRDLRGVPQTFRAGQPAGATGFHLGQIVIFALLAVLLAVYFRFRRPSADTMARCGLFGLAALMLVGALGSAVDYRWWVGLVVAVGGGTALLRRGPRRIRHVSRPQRTPLEFASAVVLCLCVIGSTWLAIASEHQALYPHSPPGHAVGSSRQ